MWLGIAGQSFKQLLQGLPRLRRPDHCFLPLIFGLLFSFFISAEPDCSKIHAHCKNICDDVPEPCKQICEQIHSIEVPGEQYNYEQQLQECETNAQVARTTEQANAKKEACKSVCGAYLKQTQRGCPDSTSHNDCESLCENQGLDDSNNFYNQNFLQQIESQKGNSCVTEIKNKFVDDFQRKCDSKINDIKDDATLICHPDGRKEDTGCEEWCNDKANEYWTDKVSNDIQNIPKHYFNENGTESVAYALATQNNIDQVTGPAVEEEVKIVDDKDNLLPARKDEGFRWWVECQKGAGMECEARVQSAVEEAIETCGESRHEAMECCHEPQSCVGGGLATALDSLGKMNMAIASLQGQKKVCEATKQTFGLYSGMTGTMAAQCIRKANACQSTCSEQVSQAAKVFKYACGVDPRKTKRHDDSVSCTRTFFNHYREQITTSNHDNADYDDINISKAAKACKQTGKESNRRIQDMTNNMGAALMASVKECEQEFPEQEWKPPPVPEWKPPDPNPTTPPSGLPTPSRTGGGGDTKKNRSLPGGDPMSTAADPFAMDPTVEEAGPEIDKGGPSGFGGLVGGGSGSGGAPGLGGSGGGGDDGGGPGRGGAGDPKKRKILLGHKGGKFTGYSGGGGNSRDSKRRGRFRKNNKKKTRGTASLDLKKLFPKKQLNNKIGKFGSPHDDIFKRIGDRMKYMCKTNRIDCK